MEVVPPSVSVARMSFDQFNKEIQLNAGNKTVVEKIIVDILENPTLNTFSEFLEIDEVSQRRKSHWNTLTNFHPTFSSSRLTTKSPSTRSNSSHSAHIVNFTRTKRSSSNCRRWWTRSWSIWQFSRWLHRRRLCRTMSWWPSWIWRMFVILKIWSLRRSMLVRNDLV